MKNDISIGKTLASSFQYLFSNFSKRLKDGFPAVIFITIAFNIHNYLMSNKIATNFTINQISQGKLTSPSSSILVGWFLCQ